MVCPTTGTYSKEYMHRCLARHVCRIRGRQARQLWLIQYARKRGYGSTNQKVHKHGVAAMLKLKRTIEHEWPTRHQPIQINTKSRITS